MRGLRAVNLRTKSEIGYVSTRQFDHCRAAGRFQPTSPRRRQRAAAIPPAVRPGPSATRRRCPISGSGLFSACGDRSIAVSGPPTSPKPLKNRDYFATVSAVRIQLSLPPKCLISLELWSRRPGFELSGRVRRFAAMLIQRTPWRDRLPVSIVEKTPRCLSWPMM